MTILFFGSSSDSLLVLEKLAGVVAVVTQETSSDIKTWAQEHNVPSLVFPRKKDKPWEFQSDLTVKDTLAPFQADLVISASFGQKIPFSGINVHPSLLPRWRGTDPVPWTILKNDHQTGVTIVTLSPTFDSGEIIAQQKIPVTTHDTTPDLRARLFALGADLLVEVLKQKKFKGTPQKISGEPYAKRLTRQDGFEPWENIINPQESERLNRKFRALHPWPGLWTRLPAPERRDGGQATMQNGKRLKILGFTHEPTIVQLEGKTPVPLDSRGLAGYLR